MADTKHTVELELVANTQKLRQNMGEASKQVKGLETSAARMKKSGFKDAGKLEAVNKKLKKHEAKKYKGALDAEKSLQKAISGRVKLLDRALGAEKKNERAIQNHVKAIRNMEQEMARLNKTRKEMGIKTARERLGEAGSWAGRKARGAGRMAMGAGVGAGAWLLGMLASQITGGFSDYVQYSKARAGLIGTGVSGAQADRYAKKGGIKWGYSPMESIGQANMLARQTGGIGGLTAAQRASRRTGMDVGEIGGYMGTFARAGQSGARNKKELEKTLAAGFVSGLDRARMPEFMQSVGTLVERQSGRAAGDVSSSEIARLLAAMGMSGKSGLQGARGGAVLSQLDAAIRGPGGGEHGQALMMQAFGFGKPGGNVSYYDALRRQEQGVSNPGNVEALFSETRTQYGGGEAQILALREMTKLSINQLEDMRDVVESNLSQEDKQKKLNELIEAAQPIDKQSLDAMQQMGDELTTIAGLQARSIEIGKDVAPAIRSIQESINRFIDEFMPTAVTLLNKIADGIKALVDYFNQGKSAGEMTSSIEKIDEERIALAEKYNRGKGDMSYREYMSALHELAAQVPTDVEPGQIAMGEHIFAKISDVYSGATGSSRRRWTSEIEDMRRAQDTGINLRGTIANQMQEASTLLGDRAAREVYDSLSPERRQELESQVSGSLQAPDHYRSRDGVLHEEWLAALREIQAQQAASVEGLAREVRGQQPQGRAAATANPASGDRGGPMVVLEGI